MTQLYMAIAALLATVAATWWFWRYRRINLAPLLGKVTVAAVVAGRLSFVLTHLDAYAAAPWHMLDLRDGGVVDVAAMFAAFATTYGAGHPMLRKPLAIALAGGAGAWAVAAILVPYFLTAPLQPPAIVLRNLEGEAVDLATFRGGPVVINLWASWCPPCRREMPLLDRAQRTHAGVRFVFVNQGEELAAIERFLGAQHLELRNVFADRLGQVGGATGSTGMPTTLFFDRHGRLAARHVGAIDAKSLAATLAALEHRPEPAN